jgi:ribonuclease BN (tRNA processing enzyme)
MANLQLHVPLAKLDAVVISHAHPDHWSDLEGLYVAMRYFLGRRGLPIYAPEGLRDLMAGEQPDGTFDWRTVGDGDTAQIGPARWRWSQTDHPVPTLASRVDAGGRALGYTADTGPGWDLSSLGEGLSLALVEATMKTEAEGTIQHLSARQAGAAARQAGAGHLVITHLAPDVDRDKARAEAEDAYGAPVDVAEVGRSWAV